METIQLISGHAMPVLGLGTWDLRGEQCKAVVKKAIELGYTHIDTAWMYENQKAIGEALREIGAERDGLFITSKIWGTHLKHNAVLTQCTECLDELQTDYVDLLLIHHPNETVPLEETLTAFEKIYDAGKAKSIGISNFNIEQVEKAREISQVPISVNQVEYHVRHNRENLLAHCQKNYIILTAHRPLAKGELLNEPLLETIAGKHSKTPAQIALRWLLQKGMVVIPKASSEFHLSANFSVFDWELTRIEMQQINNLTAGNHTI